MESSLYTGTCRKCGNQFQGGSRQQVYCSPECRIAYLYPSAKPKPCASCGAEFTPRNNQRYCSPECRPTPAPRPRKPAADHSRPCSVCGEVWTPSDARVAETRCTACREKDKAQFVYARHKNWRRAVFNRAEGHCEECGKTAGESGGPLHAHHVIPRSDGGTNSLANGKLLCIPCHGEVHDGNVGGWTFAQHDEDAMVEKIARRVVELLTESPPENGNAPKPRPPSFDLRVKQLQNQGMTSRVALREALQELERKHG